MLSQFVMLLRHNFRCGRRCCSRTGQCLGSWPRSNKIPLYFQPDAGVAQDVIRGLYHKGRGLIIGSGWDKELAAEKGYDFLSAAVPTPYRLVLTTNYAGFTGGLRVIEDIYQTVLAIYK